LESWLLGSACLLETEISRAPFYSAPFSLRPVFILPVASARDAKQRLINGVVKVGSREDAFSQKMPVKQTNIYLYVDVSRAIC
jgi:hypothetical protein